MMLGRDEKEAVELAAPANGCLRCEILMEVSWRAAQDNAELLAKLYAAEKELARLNASAQQAAIRFTCQRCSAPYVFSVVPPSMCKCPECGCEMQPNADGTVTILHHGARR